MTQPIIFFIVTTTAVIVYLMLRSATRYEKKLTDFGDDIKKFSQDFGTPVSEESLEELTLSVYAKPQVAPYKTFVECVQNHPKSSKQTHRSYGDYLGLMKGAC